ncbi:MAG: hypothetical protein ACOX6M_09765 [Armatimonadota bacterium]|jgi:hypothetical protein
MSRIAAQFLLVAVITVLALAGCGGKPSAKDKATGEDLTAPLTLPQGGLDPGKAPAPTGAPAAPAAGAEDAGTE